MPIPTPTQSGSVHAPTSFDSLCSATQALTAFLNTAPPSTAKDDYMVCLNSQFLQRLLLETYASRTLLHNSQALNIAQLVLSLTYLIFIVCYACILYKNRRARQQRQQKLGELAQVTEKIYRIVTPLSSRMEHEAASMAQQQVSDPRSEDEERTTKLIPNSTANYFCSQRQTNWPCCHHQQQQQSYRQLLSDQEAAVGENMASVTLPLSDQYCMLASGPATADRQPNLMITGMPLRYNPLPPRNSTNV